MLRNNLRPVQLGHLVIAAGSFEVLIKSRFFFSHFHQTIQFLDERTRTGALAVGIPAMLRVLRGRKVPAEIIEGRQERGLEFGRLEHSLDRLEALFVALKLLLGGLYHWLRMSA